MPAVHSPKYHWGPNREGGQLPLHLLLAVLWHHHVGSENMHQVNYNIEPTSSLVPHYIYMACTYSVQMTVCQFWFWNWQMTHLCNYLPHIHMRSKSLQLQWRYVIIWITVYSKLHIENIFNQHAWYAWFSGRHCDNINLTAIVWLCKWSSEIVYTVYKIK